jgi:hypothetical protein
MNIGTQVLYEGREREVVEINGDELVLAITEEGAETALLTVLKSEVTEINDVVEEPVGSYSDAGPITDAPSNDGYEVATEV